jgi:hypothetical protein
VFLDQGVEKPVRSHAETRLRTFRPIVGQRQQMAG